MCFFSLAYCTCLCTASGADRSEAHRHSGEELAHHGEENICIEVDVLSILVAGSAPSGEVAVSTQLDAIRRTTAGRTKVTLLGTWA